MAESAVSGRDNPVADIDPGGLLSWPPDVRRRAFRYMDRLYTYRVVTASDQPRHRAPAQTTTELPGDSGVHAVLVSVDGNLVREQYVLGHGIDQLWPSFSAGKSIISTLVGCALADGLIGSLDDPVCRYLPQLRGTAFDGVTLRHLQTMSSGIAWDEDSYEASEDAEFFARVWSEQLGGRLLPFIGGHARVSRPGERFQYNSGNTHVLAEVLAAVLDRSLSDYLSDKIWRPCGMEHEALWMLDAPGGIESGSILATGRDFLTFGEAFLDCVLGGSSIALPAGWARLATLPGAPEEVEYGFSWWTAPGGIFEARGVYGQLIHVDPTQRLVAVFLAVEATGTAVPDYGRYLGQSG